MGRLDGKTAIITGATSGIGRAAAEIFVREGAKIVFAGRRESNGAELEAKLRASGGDATFVKTDVTKEADVKKLVKTAAEVLGRIDILVNNAGVVSHYDGEKFDIKRDFDDVFEVNIRAYMLMIREVLPHMTAQKSGSIVNTSSISAICGAPDIASYAASKGAVLSYTKTLAGECAPRGIRVNTVLPGLTNSDMVPVGSDFEKLGVQMIPLGRAARPEEIAAGILFFASDEASFCTGSSLVIDGGATAM
ncbi:MAG: SDR family oxidoreductase [Oscillospiraceae bacterium]|jgi:NAD(P)-dependent dehydrogenase (short-subunit alcohol dehydrogenase family)|nr:SDR family oxidoreductase [Oscillospiraceae bacterium]